MEATSQVLVPSPSSPDNAIVSPESLSHHSSPAKSSRVLHYAQHVTIDETRLPSSLRSSHQLLQQSRRSTSSSASPPPPFQSGPLTPTMSVLSNNSLNRVDSSQMLVPHHSSAFRIDSQTTKSPGSPTTAASTTTQHLAVLYQTHHHLHPILTSPTRRPSRLPDTSRFLHQQALGYSPAQREIKAWVKAEKLMTVKLIKQQFSELKYAINTFKYSRHEFISGGVVNDICFAWLSRFRSDAFCSTLSALYGKILVVMGWVLIQVKWCRLNPFAS